MYDIIIIGCGPAGLFAANELAKTKKIAMFDAGVDLSEKKCPIESGERCKYCRPVCNIMGGFGGAQFFEGTKLSIYPAGSGIVNFCGDINKTKQMYEYIDQVLEHYGKEPRTYPKNEDINNLVEAFKRQQIEMKYYNAQKVSKATMNKIALNMKQYLCDNNVDIFLQERVINVIKNKDKTFTLITNKGTYTSKNIVFAVGRVGSRQLVKMADNLGIEYENEEQEIELGVRIEMPYKVFDGINNIHNDLKLKFKLNDNEELRTFCQDYKGFITKCVYNMKDDEIISTLDGHIIGTDEAGGRMSDVVNLAVHHRYKVNCSIDEIYDIVGKMSANKRPLVQSLKNFMQNTNEKNIFSNAFSMPDVVEANINDYIPERTFKVLKDFIRSIDKVLPGFADDGNTVYAPSFEMGWKKFVISRELETSIKGIYIIGDVTGHFRGAMQAMASGVLVARKILEKDMD